MAKTGIIYGINGPIIYVKDDVGFPQILPPSRYMKKLLESSPAKLLQVQEPRSL